ncbi:pentatricopeptide repeat-containing protein At5g66520-like [Zingiber officinale]|uniref:pentatricopeptide repeat-containing protein At5g66520-like n=1 Tax=Zingiber officinale TaxID=94328 RepID=UPI001C4ABEC4|nr:pentatricopeptide repeat-containing protein At5g66520-like [Zingiber officinale]
MSKEYFSNEMLYLPALRSSKPYSRDLQKQLFLMLQHCRSMQQLSQLHAKLVVNGFFYKNVLITKLLSCCIASGNISYASLVFNQVLEPNTTLCNQMIRATFRSDMPGRSVYIYNRMRSKGGREDTQPNSYTYAFLLAACTKAGPNFLTQGEQLHCRVISGGFGSSIYVQTNLINMYSATSSDGISKSHMIFKEIVNPNIISCNSMLAGFLRSGNVLLANQFFHDMPAKDKVSWTTMIAGYAKTGMSDQALKCFSQMRTHIKPDQVTMIAVLTACANWGDLELGRLMHGYSCQILHGQKCLVNLNNALIHMYVKCGAIDDAFQVFTQMSRKNTASWTTIIAGLAKHGCGNEALDLFQRMQENDVENEKPDWLTFIAVLCACSYLGMVDKGLFYFEQMITNHRIIPRMEHYCCIVDMLSRAGHLNQALEMIKKMPMEPNFAIWGALLGGCWIHKDVKLAAQIIDKLMEHEPDKVAGHLVSVSNIYAAAMKRGVSQEFREMMLEMSIRKPTASSLIYMQGGNV